MIQHVVVRAGVALAAVGCALVAACASAGGPAGTGGRRSSCPLRAQDSVFVASGPVYRDCAVDRQAELVSQLHPEFRADMTQQCYSAEMEFVVGANGLPETETARLVRSNNREFADAVATLVPRLKYRPAIRDGTAVRQIVSYKQQALTRVVVVPMGSAPPPPAAPLPTTC